MQVVGLWEETGEPGENPRTQGENMQTPHGVSHQCSLEIFANITDGVKSTAGVLHLFRKLRNGQMYLLANGDMFHSSAIMTGGFKFNMQPNEIRTMILIIHILRCLPDSAVGERSRP